MRSSVTPRSVLISMIAGASLVGLRFAAMLNSTHFAVAAFTSAPSVSSTVLGAAENSSFSLMISKVVKNSA